MLRRQNTFDSFGDAEKQQNGQAANFCLLAPAIVAVVIASEYNENAACGTDEPDGGYTVDLVAYLNTAGYITIGWAAFVLTCNCFMRCVCSAENQLKAAQALIAPVFCFILFQIAWASVGLYMYDNEFSDGCKDTSIAKMILSWGIIQISLFGLVVCCLCTAMICAGGVAALSS